MFGLKSELTTLHNTLARRHTQEWERERENEKNERLTERERDKTDKKEH